MKIFTMSTLIILTISSNIYSQNIWERTNSLDNLIIYSLAINSNGDIFAGTDASGLFRSTDNGNSWTNLGFTNDWIHGNGIAISPSEELLIVTDNHYAGGGVIRSTDNGNNWDSLGLTNNAKTSIAINSSGHLFVGTAAQGVYRSTDNGLNFIQINLGLPDTGLSPISFTINTSGHIFVGTVSAGVFRSTNNGDSWVQINQGITNYQILSLGTNSNGYIFAGTSGGGAFRSTDNGANWVQINQGLTGEGLYIFSVAINSDGYIFAGTADGVFRSTDNGVNWIQMNQGLTSFGVLSLAINLNGDIFAGTLDGVFRTIPSANIRVFLQGPYVSATGTMSTTLNTNGYIPLTQPYSAAPWNYAGTESVASGFFSTHTDIVDWVLLELRTGTGSTTIAGSRAAFLLSDGSVVDLDGVSNVKFPGVAPGDYFTVVRHRNHLAIMTTNPVTLSFSPNLYDFSTGSDQFYGGSVGSVQLSTSPIRWGMFGGDGNSSGIVTNSDKDAIINNLNNAGYYNGDTNFSGIVTNSDKDLIINNLNKSSSLP